MMGQKGVTKTCAKTYTEEEVVDLQYMIYHGYTYRLTLDDLPSATIHKLKNN
jgi:hypothetical protein